MSEDKAMQYEALIRAAHREGNRTVGRYGVAGADADIYRRLDRVACEPNDPYEQGLCMGRTAAYIETALEKVKKEHSSDGVFTKRIEECLSLLSEPTMAKIDECIDKARDAFISIELRVS